jgi:hypothetical protein
MCVMERADVMESERVVLCFFFVSLFTELQMRVMERADVMESERVNMMLDSIFQIAAQ